MADEDLRSSRQDNVYRSPEKILFGIFTLSTTDGTSNIFTVPQQTRVIDAFLNVITAIGGSTPAQTLALEAGTTNIITGVDATSGGVTRMTIAAGNVLIDSAAKEVINILRSSTSGTALTSAVVAAMLIVRRDVHA